MSEEVQGAPLADDVAVDPRPLEVKQPEAEPEAPKPVKTTRESVADAIAKVEKEEAEKAKAEEAKPVAKDGDKVDPDPAEVKAEAKPKPDADAAAKPEAKSDADAEKPDGKQPPARLLPKAREVWHNTPNVVKSEFDRMEREHAAEIETHREAKAFHEELREYDTMAKGAKTTVKAALDRYVNFDKVLSQDFGQGVKAIGDDQKKTPVQVIASVIRAYGGTPEQLAQAILKDPTRFRAEAPQQQRQAQPDPVMARVAQLEAKIAETEAAAKREAVARDVIAPFEAKHPRFAELQEPIAKILKSGMVPESLSTAERLEVAYDMAERINPSPRRPAIASDEPDHDADAVKIAAGRKSIGGAPGNGSTVKAKSPQIMSVREAVLAAARQHGV